MPRTARIDTPGLLHHVIGRGIEQRDIFPTKTDYADFIQRIETCLEKSPNEILAWALMPNHFHLLIRSGPQGMVSFMRRLMTGYAGGFNARHKRSGHLFQNRYKSIVCDEAAYLLELVRYIHLNPLRGGLVKTMTELGNFPYTGHRALLGYGKTPWQSLEAVLNHFSSTEKTARQRYLEFVTEGVSQGRREDLMGGGLGRSGGGRPREVRLDHRGAGQLFDARVLGSGEFVEKVLEKVEKTESLQRDIARQNITMDDIAAKVAGAMKIDVQWLYLRNRTRKVSEAKSLLTFLATEYLGKNNAEMARTIKMSPAAAGRARQRGMVLAQGLNVGAWFKVN